MESEIMCAQENTGKGMFLETVNGTVGTVIRGALGANFVEKGYLSQLTEPTWAPHNEKIAGQQQLKSNNGI